MTQVGRPFDPDEVIPMIGRMNLFAISGGRVHVIANDDAEVVRLELPVSNGYRVAVELGWDDTFTVSREFVRKGTVWNKGTVEGIHFPELGEMAYQASCFRNVEFGEKVTV